MRVLVVNAGSSTLKLTLLDGEERVVAEQTLASGDAGIDSAALRAALAGPLGKADAVGHRIVHGGERFRAAVKIDAGVEEALRELAELAPLHQRKSLAALDAVGAALPGVPAFACFDTAFHASLPQAAATYALPASWRERWGLRRYGFHGLSHAWVARRAPQMLARRMPPMPAPYTPQEPAPDAPREPALHTPPAPARDSSSTLRIVSCHLGAGASLCAIAGGRSIDTTMGFTPLEGLVMATRSGSVDPGMLLWLLEREGISAAELADALEHRSGLLGLAGSADMREILARAGRGETTAQLALDVYVHRLRAGVAAMAAALGGLDALVFTGGVGEHAAEVRARAAEGLGFLGVELDEQRNRAAAERAETRCSTASGRTGAGKDIGANANIGADADIRSDADIGADADISAEGSAARTLVLTAREDLEIARQVRELARGS